VATSYCDGNDQTAVKSEQMRWTKTAKLCKSISDSSGRVWAKNWYTFISNWDYEILQWIGSVPKKNCEGFPMFFTIENFEKAFLGDMKQWWSRH
jgi:hypothetical protein